MNIFDETETSKTSNSKFPSLVSLCQRVAISNADRLTSLGDNFRFDLVRPVLQHCTAETLLQLEQATPSLAQDTSELWQALCFHAYPLLAQEQYAREAPESWRDAYFILGDLEAERLEGARDRMRIQRELEAERKKQSQIIFKPLAELPPPHKRSRAWGPTQPKTLLQRTRSDVLKMQKGIYASPLMSRKPNPKFSRPLPNAASATTSPSSSSAGATHTASGSHVTVRTVTVRRPQLKPLKPQNTSSASQTVSDTTPTVNGSTTQPSDATSNSNSPAPCPDTERGTGRRTDKPPVAKKKDPMAALFMPKKHAFSQLPATSNFGSRP